MAVTVGQPGTSPSLRAFRAASDTTQLGGIGTGTPIAPPSRMNDLNTNYASAGTAPPKTREHLQELLHEFDTATVVTRSKASALHGRPMAVADVDEAGDVWFISNVDSPKVLEIREDSRGMVALQKSRQFVTMNGHFELVSDRAKVEQLWKEPYRVWFDGEGDPELVLLRFTPDDAEYWDSSGAKGVRYALEAAKAYLSGEKVRPEQDPEAHAKLTL